MRAREKIRKIEARQNKHKYSRWYAKELQSLLGHTWAMFYVILGGRMTGKSYSITEFLIKQHKKYKQNVKNYWLRISESSTQAMLANKASKTVDPDLVETHKMSLSTKGMTVFNHGEKFIEIMPLSKMAKLKGVAFFDKNFKGIYNIVLDEFQLEQGEKRTSFDILYNFIGMLENIIRTTKNRVRVFLVGNTLEEASSILKAFNFLPEGFGRFYLKRKRCIIDNIAPTDEYLADRKGSVADILGGGEMSNYTNELKKDISLISKERLSTPKYKIIFGKQKNKQYLVWNNNVITRYKGQPVNEAISMRPYLDERYSPDRKQIVLDMFDAQNYKFDTLITLSYFQSELQLIRKT